MNDKLTIWWGIPCKSMVPVFREAFDKGRDVEFVSLFPLSEQRKALKWSLPDAGKMPLTILEDDWRAEVEQIFARRAGVHILNGLWHNERIRYVLRQVCEHDRDFGMIMEAPSNLEHGWRRLIKTAIADVRSRYLSRGAVAKGMFVCSASGDRVSAFRKLGFAESAIFPFGYFPEFPKLKSQVNSNAPLRLLCIGYLEPYKGHDTLIDAIALLKAYGLEARCAITGYGSAASRLKEKVENLGLEGQVSFLGVLEQSRLHELFAQSDVLIAPGFEEPWGIRVNEGLLAGLPVVVSSGVGAQELIAASGAGRVFKARDPHSLASSVADLKEEMNERPAELQAKITAVAEHISPKSAADYLLAVLDKVQLRDSGPAPAPPWLDFP